MGKSIKPHLWHQRAHSVAEEARCSRDEVVTQIYLGWRVVMKKLEKVMMLELSPEGGFWGEAETPIFWPPHEKSWLIGKDADAGRDWGQEEKGMTEDEMVGWHHRLDGHEFEWTLGVGDGQGAWHAAIHGVNKSRTQLSDWTELNWCLPKVLLSESFLFVCFVFIFFLVLFYF